MPPSPSLRSSLTQFFPPKAVFTAKNVPNDLRGKVYLVTGANSGMGHELARTLYAKNAKVYVACRSEEKGIKAIESMKKTAPKSNGELVFLSLDLADLAKVKAAAQKFLAQESKLHVLFK
jgi:retinol dehydrogenase-12